MDNHQTGAHPDTTYLSNSFSYAGVPDSAERPAFALQFQDINIQRSGEYPYFREDLPADLESPNMPGECNTICGPPVVALTSQQCIRGLADPPNFNQSPVIDLGNFVTYSDYSKSQYSPHGSLGFNPAAESPVHGTNFQLNQLVTNCMRFSINSPHTPFTPFVPENIHPLPQVYTAWANNNNNLYTPSPGVASPLNTPEYKLEQRSTSTDERYFHHLPQPPFLEDDNLPPNLRRVPDTTMGVTRQSIGQPQGMDYDHPRRLYQPRILRDDLLVPGSQEEDMMMPQYHGQPEGMSDNNKMKIKEVVANRIIEFMDGVEVSPDNEFNPWNKELQLSALNDYILSISREDPDIRFWLEKRRVTVGTTSGTNVARDKRKLEGNTRRLHYCLWCNNTFTTKNNLSKHVRSHLNLFLAFCAGCGLQTVDRQIPPRHGCPKKIPKSAPPTYATTGFTGSSAPHPQQWNDASTSSNILWNNAS